MSIVAPTPISALPTAPSLDDPVGFDTTAEAFVDALPAFRTQANALAENVYDNAGEVAISAAETAASALAAASSAGAAAGSASDCLTQVALAQAAAAASAVGVFTTATSTTSLTIPTPVASLSLTFVESGKAFSKGMYILAVRTSDATKRMIGLITAVDNTAKTMTLSVEYVNGSGTFTDWTLSLSAPLNAENSQADAEAGTSSAPGMSPRRGAQQIAQLASLGPVLFGDGSDGDVTISGSVTLSRDMFYNNLTIAAGAVLVTTGWRVFVLGTLDLTAAPSNAIRANGSNGGNASAGTAGAAGTASVAHTVGVGKPSVIGAAGQIGDAAQGTTGVAGGNGGNGGSSGASYAATGAGATARAGVSSSATVLHRATTLLTTTDINPATLIDGGSSGASGAGGAGDTSSIQGGGGGASGAGGNILFLCGKFINRGASTGGSAIQAKGGNGGNGASGPSGASAGVGGAGGGGGWVYILCQALLGTLMTNVVNVSGGDGGSGGDQGSGSSAADGGGAGGSGRFTMTELKSGTMTDNSGGAAALTYNTKSGTSGGAVKSATSIKYSL